MCSGLGNRTQNLGDLGASNQTARIFAPLALGPFFGVWAMSRLRAQPESTRLANGRR